MTSSRSRRVRGTRRPVQLDEAACGLGETGRAAQADPPLEAGCRHGDLPAPVDGAEGVVDTHPGVGEEHLGETGLAVELGDGADRDPGRVERHQDEREPTVALGRRIGPEDAEKPVGEGAPGAPGLLAVQDPLRPVVGQHRPASDPGQVTAGIGLGPSLGPDIDAGRHPGQEAELLRLGPYFDDRRAEQEDPVLVDPSGRTGPVVLLFEDQPFDVVGAAAAVLLGPGDRRPAALVQLGLPGPVLLEALSGVEGGQRLGRDMRLEPGPSLLAKGLFVGGVGEVHAGATISDSSLAGWAPKTRRALHSPHDRRHHQSGQEEVAAVDGWFTLDADDPRLLGNRCTTCGTFFFPRADFFCRNPECEGTVFEEVPLSRRGRVWSYTVNRYQPPPPYIADRSLYPLRHRRRRAGRGEDGGARPGGRRRRRRRA